LDSNAALNGASLMTKRIKSGVDGLDELIEGGFLKGHTVLLAGNTGSGKTIFSTQFIFNGATQLSEKGVYATLEEDAETLKDNMFRLRFDPEKLEKERMIKLLTSRR